MKTPALLLAALCAALATPAFGASSAIYDSPTISARLVAAPNGVAPGVGVISAGLAVELKPGWKTYWRTPGEVGLPPHIDWVQSENIADLRMLFPAPERFRAFGIENYGYGGRVLYPLELTLAAPGEAMTLAADVSLLVCSTICVPEQFPLSLDLPPGFGVDMEAAAAIADAAARTPDESGAGFAALTAGFSPDGGALAIQLTSAEPLLAPDVFPEMGPGAAFGPPDIRLAEDGRLLWAEFPVTNDPDPDATLVLTLVDRGAAATLTAPALAAAPAPPGGVAEGDIDWAALLGVIGLALLGGLILNAMPCVLPVLSLKVGAALKAQGGTTAQMRRGFLAAAAGVLAFMLALAAVLVVMRAAGAAVGWGLHFQNPVVVALMFGVVALFAANLFGLFEVRLPSRLNTALARADGNPGLAGDFAAGAFGAMLATPCSAPFLGAAVAYALAGGPVDVFAVFAALGVGLAAPYLVLAAAPRLLAALPKPGPWMATVKAGLGLALAAAAVWLLWILIGVGGSTAAMIAAIAAAVAVAALSVRAPTLVKGAAGVVAFAALLAAPLAAPPAPALAASVADHLWAGFERGAIARAVARGETVFVDVTADWCLTCKANKALVLDREPVASVLSAPGVLPMQADWTRPDPAIARYLESHGRFGIPFNVVYGPAAPDGLPLPEILDAAGVVAALQKAGG